MLLCEMPVSPVSRQDGGFPYGRDKRGRSRCGRVGWNLLNAVKTRRLPAHAEYAIIWALCFSVDRLVRDSPRGTSRERQRENPCGEETKMKKLIAIGVLLAFAAMLGGYGKECERSSGSSDNSGEYNSGEDSDGETKIFTLPGGVRMEMVYVAPGSFQMGSENGRDDEKPVHKVTLTKGYWIGKYPVTQAQWNALVSAMDVSFDRGRPVAWFSKNGMCSDIVGGMDTSDFPMENISWNDCKALVDALNKEDREGRRWSLPTEAQWEFAARGGNKSRGYTYSGGNDLDAVGWYYENSGTRRLSDSDWKKEDLTSNKCRPHSVKEKDIGNELGIVGMSGNVWEWCNDWYDKNYYSSSPTEDPQGPASIVGRVSRGGSWDSFAWRCRSANRFRSFPGYRRGIFGFRLCGSAGPREAGAEQKTRRRGENRVDN